MTTPRACCIVTGHSRGIGEGVAAALLERGARVLGVSRRANDALAKRYPEQLRQRALDLADAAATERWLASSELKDFCGGAAMTVLVNNAGILQPIGPLDVQAVGTALRAATVNVAAALALSAAFAQATDSSEDRRILHISSGAGRKAYAGWSVYCATKAALDHHARAVAMDHTARLRIVSLAPGVVDTEMQAEIRASNERLFPDQARFIAMHREGSLPDAAAKGRAIAEYLMSDTFGREPVDDLRA